VAIEEDLLVYLRGARVPFVVRVAEGPVELLEGGIVRRRRDVDSGFGFLKCSIVGECLVNGFDKFVQDDNEVLNATGEMGWTNLLAKKSFSSGMGRTFVIS
jgi:hypothetical protein